MFGAILSYLSDGIADVFALFADVLVGGVSLFWDNTAQSLTQLGEIMLLSAIVGLVLFGIRFIRNVIPFVK
jgi:hypothetical protein